MPKISPLLLPALVLASSRVLTWHGHAAASPPSPVVQMLVPGFSVQELPLRLNNINNLVYAPDGRLFALCYDGNVLQLKDTDGDGREETATHFYKNENNEIRPSIGMAWGPGGLYIASQGRVIRLRDKGDGTATLETLTEGWVPPTGKAGSSLDAVGIAVDPAGNVFFGLGCDNWQEAYRVNKSTGKSDYNIKSERGTILKLSPEGKQREIISTGLRFTVSLAFNAAGDLFCTDQEGATWLPNGNPFDELLHLQKGRHYGFPPRHPQYFPDVIDEPSQFDYSPQHQSTCGLHFNEPVAGGKKSFGPAWWRGDAIVAGESRGKIWRTKLVKTPAGYVAQNQLIACLDMLTIDAVPTPQGDLLVACHSGKPDWGTGPSGQGKLFKISYTTKTAPQPVLVYAAGPTETRVIFDSPLNPGQIKNLVKQSRFTKGRYVAAGDRFEGFSPGYQAVKDQATVSTSPWPVLSAGVSADRLSLVLQTAPRTEAANFALTLPSVSTAGAGTVTAETLPQQPAIDLLLDLTGVEASWRAAAATTNWNGWLPHLDLGAARGFTGASAEHNRLFALLQTPGTLSLKAQLDLWQMLHPPVQPGATLSYDYPPEIITVVFKSSHPLQLKSSEKVERFSPQESRLTLVSRPNAWLPVEVMLTTGPGEPSLEVSWFTREDARPRAFPLRRLLLPWATPHSEAAPETGQRRIPEIAGGNWQQGRQLFFGDKAACSKCHQVGGEGGKIGPDLSNLVFRDYTSVLKDITQPSAAINPDHLSFNIELRDGDIINGVILEDTPGNLVVGQATGSNLSVTKSRVASVKASNISLMPEGLLEGFSAQEQRDLLTYLLLTQPVKDKTK